MTATPGSLLSHYRLLEKIGEGGMGLNCGRARLGPPPGCRPPRPQAGQHHADELGAKVLDFGLAKLRGPQGTPAAPGLSTLPTEGGRPLTAEGVIVGTMQYMAPEQLEGKEADA